MIYRTASSARAEVTADVLGEGRLLAVGGATIRCGVYYCDREIEAGKVAGGYQVDALTGFLERVNQRLNFLRWLLSTIIIIRM